ncbi:MAG: DsbA family oxidoreductase [Burkholderiaceae bacterium]
MNAPAVELTIDVVSDVVCPWCFVGKRQLEQAVEALAAEAPEARVTVSWHPFQLNPELPDHGMTRSDYLQAKFGSRDTKAIYERVKTAAGQVGLELAMERIGRQPNTVRPHALIAVADAKQQPAVVEALFRAYFVEGRDLTDEATLIETGRAAGLPEPAIESAMRDEGLAQTIRNADSSARQMGVNGVPFFIFNRSLAVSGAAGAQTLKNAALKALADGDPGPDAD